MHRGRGCCDFKSHNMEQPDWPSCSSSVRNPIFLAVLHRQCCGFIREVLVLIPCRIVCPILYKSTEDQKQMSSQHRRCKTNTQLSEDAEEPPGELAVEESKTWSAYYYY